MKRHNPAFSNYTRVTRNCRPYDKVVIESIEQGLASSLTIKVSYFYPRVSTWQQVNKKDLFCNMWLYKANKWLRLNVKANKREGNVDSFLCSWFEYRAVAIYLKQKRTFAWFFQSIYQIDLFRLKQSSLDLSNVVKTNDFINRLKAFNSKDKSAMMSFSQSQYRLFLFLNSLTISNIWLPFHSISLKFNRNA